MTAKILQWSVCASALYRRLSSLTVLLQSHVGCWSQATSGLTRILGQSETHCRTFCACPLLPTPGDTWVGSTNVAPCARSALAGVCWGKTRDRVRRPRILGRHIPPCRQLNIANTRKFLLDRYHPLLFENKKYNYVNRSRLLTMDDYDGKTDTAGSSGPSCFWLCCISVCSSTN